jgi:hypothetical protein
LFSPSVLAVVGSLRSTYSHGRANGMRNSSYDFDTYHSPTPLVLVLLRLLLPPLWSVQSLHFSTSRMAHTFGMPHTSHAPHFSRTLYTFSKRVNTFLDEAYGPGCLVSTYRRNTTRQQCSKQRTTLLTWSRWRYSKIDNLTSIDKTGAITQSKTVSKEHLE